MDFSYHGNVQFKYPGEIAPPWVVVPSTTPFNLESIWRAVEGKEWLKNVFLPFYDSLTDEEQMQYWLRWGAPQSWLTLFLHPSIDEVAAEADSELFGTKIESLDYRKIFLE